MFRAVILPIFRCIGLCVTACGIMHPRCCRPVAWKLPLLFSFYCLLAKKGTTLQNKQTSPEVETIKRLIKQKRNYSKNKQTSPNAETIKRFIKKKSNYSPKQPSPNVETIKRLIKQKRNYYSKQTNITER